MSSSLLTDFDDYIRRCKIIIASDCTKEFLGFVRNQSQLRLQWKEAIDECQRLRVELDKAVLETSSYEKKLSRARNAVHEEQSRADRAEAERDELYDQLQQIQEIMGSIRRAGDKLANETKEKLDKFLNTTHTKLGTSDGLYPRLDTINEINSTGDLLSDLSCCTRSEDNIDLDMSDRVSRLRKTRRSETKEEIPSKRRRSSRLSACGVKKTTRDQLVATTTVTIPAGGPVTASARIETFPPESIHPFPATSTSQPSTATSSDSDVPPPFRSAPLVRPHEFALRTHLKPPTSCCACLKSIGFGTKMAHCDDCKANSHVECRDGVPVPCVPMVATPRGDQAPRLSDMCGTSPPFVPPLLVRCVLEVEHRGLTELGLYRVPGSEKEVRALKNRLLRGKAASSLASYDIHVVCGVLKDFLRSLPEPIVTHLLWPRFTNAVRENGEDRAAALYQVVSELPPPNRDTLSFIILHLLKVTQSPPCKMTTSNLSMVFGPTLVGYSSSNPSNTDIGVQTPLQAMVVEGLLDLGEDYWRSLLHKEHATPLLTPKYSFRKRNVQGKSFKLFNTPPAK